MTLPAFAHETQIQKKNKYGNNKTVRRQIKIKEKDEKGDDTHAEGGVRHVRVLGARIKFLEPRTRIGMFTFHDMFTV